LKKLGLSIIGKKNDLLQRYKDSFITSIPISTNKDMVPQKSSLKDTQSKDNMVNQTNENNQAYKYILKNNTLFNSKVERYQHLEELTDREIKKELRTRGLKTSGNNKVKRIFLNRLRASYLNESNEKQKDNLTQLLENEKHANSISEDKENDSTQLSEESDTNEDQGMIRLPLIQAINSPSAKKLKNNKRKRENDMSENEDRLTKKPRLNFEDTNDNMEEFLPQKLTLIENRLLEEENSTKESDLMISFPPHLIESLTNIFNTLNSKYKELQNTINDCQDQVAIFDNIVDSLTENQNFVGKTISELKAIVAT